MKKRKIANTLRKALLQDGKMERALYEYELEEHLDYWYEGLKSDRDQFVFAITENSGDVAMVLITPDKTIYVIDILTAVNGRRFPNLTIWVSASFPKDFSHLP